jgi:hypothetical protein
MAWAIMYKVDTKRAAPLAGLLVPYSFCPSRFNPCHLIPSALACLGVAVATPREKLLNTTLKYPKKLLT